MRSGKTIAVGLAAILVGWAAATAQVQRVPGPGTGIVTVTGEVSIANKPTVVATQQGDWDVTVSNTVPVSVTNTPAVTMALPLSLKKGNRYEIVWATGEREVVTAAQPGTSSWVRVERTGITGPRWVNVAAARAITELQ